MRTTLAALALLVSTTSDVDAAPLTLPEAIARAASSNPALASASLDVEAAGAAQTSAAGAYDVALDASLTGTLEHARPQPIAGPQPLGTSDVAGAAAVTKRFERGAELTAGVSLHRTVARTRVATTDGTDDLDQRTITPRLEASWREPLLGGRTIGVAIRARLAAEHAATVDDRTATAAAIVRDVEHAYWALYLAQREVQIRHDAIKAAELQLRQAQAEIERGARPRLAAAEIEEELARRREDELVATTAIAERSLDLSRLLGAPPTTELRAADAPPELVAAPGSSASPPQLEALAHRSEAALAVVAQTEDEARWRLDAAVTGALAAPRERYPDAVTSTGSLGGWSIGVTLTLHAPLDDRGPRAKVAAARARLAQARLAEQDAAASLAAEVQRLANQRTVAGQRRLALARAVSLADQNLAAEQNRWERGDTTAYEVLRRQTAVGEMRLRAERARIDELAADTALAAATGELLARRGVMIR